MCTARTYGQPAGAARSARSSVAKRRCCVSHRTMGNQIAIRVHTRRGKEVIAESRAHILGLGDGDDRRVFRLPCACRPRCARHSDLEAYRTRDLWARSFRAATGLIEIENTANLAGWQRHPAAGAGRDLGRGEGAQAAVAS